jgi:predicted component of type VI protein secretion system
MKWYLHTDTDCFWRGAHYLGEEKFMDINNEVNPLFIARILLSQSYQDCWHNDQGHIDEFVYESEYQHE